MPTATDPAGTDQTVVEERSLPERERRARREAMELRTLRDGRFVVETDGGTYVVDLEAGSCTCPDASIRETRCKHQRRVLFELDRGALSPPPSLELVCAVCGERYDPAEGGALLCRRHRPERGEFVRDRETGALCVVVGVTTVRADEYRPIVRTDENADDDREVADRTVAEYPTNEDYGDHEPVVLAAYADSFGPAETIDSIPRYAFPASRLVRLGEDRGSIRLR